MDLRKLKKLIDLVEESGIAEIEVTEGEEKVRITRTIANNQPVYAAMHHAPQPMLAPAPAVAAPGTAAPVAAAIASYCWLDTSFTLTDIIGFIAILATVFLITIRK